MKNCITFLLGLAISANSTIAMSQVIDQVAVVVDHSVVLESDVNSMLAAVTRRAQKVNQSLPAYAMLRRQVLDRLIMDNILFQLAQRFNLTISTEQLDHAISNISANNHMTTDQLRRYLVYDGINYNTYCMKISKDILFSELRNIEVHHRIAIAPQVVNSLVPQIASQTGNSAELNRGTEFANLAIAYSAKPKTIKVIQLGWKKIEELPSMFDASLQGAQQKNIVGNIHSGVGVHIMKVNDIRGCPHKTIGTEFHIQHIILHTSMFVTDQQVRAKLEEMASQIKIGRIGFNNVAKQLSEDPFSAHQGGELGWSSLGLLEPSFRVALMQLKKNEISKPVHSSFGWHIIQLIDTRQLVLTNIDQQDQAYRLLFNCKFAEESQNWMQEKRALAYVKIVDKHE